jgi:hypothetical protein
MCCLCMPGLKPMDEGDLELLYSDLTKVAESEEYDISHVARTIAIFRVAIEYGASSIGFPFLTYLMAKLLTVALGITAGDKSASYEDILDLFEEEDQLKH